VWVLEEIVEEPRRGRRPAPVRGAAGTRPTAATALSDDVLEEITKAAGRDQAGRVAERLAAAASAYERDRYQDALRMTRSVLELAPRSSTALELQGLVCYRLGRWRDALRYLRAAAELAGTDESQIPVLMDCHRALGHRKRVRELWRELREASPPADVLVEGRLVLAATLRDEGRLDEAIDELVRGGAQRSLRHPADRHVRQWYLLADLYDRAGDIPKARELFARVVDADPEVADARERLAGLGRRRAPRGERHASRAAPAPKQARSAR